jgi:hypothetical protein
VGEEVLVVREGEEEVVLVGVLVVIVIVVVQAEAEELDGRAEEVDVVVRRVVLGVVVGAEPGWHCE